MMINTTATTTTSSTTTTTRKTSSSSSLSNTNSKPLFRSDTKFDHLLLELESSDASTIALVLRFSFCLSKNDFFFFDQMMMEN